jgi:hypothetical protein
MNPETYEQPLVFSIRQHAAAFLSTRASAADARRMLEHQLEPSDDRLIIIDFAGVEAMTNSYADELIGKLYGALAAGDVTSGGVQIIGLNEETRDAVTVCLERRKLFAVDAEQQTLLAADDILQTTYDQTRQLSAFRAADLARELDVTATNANNRLKRLVAAGALRRERSQGPESGGRQYTYCMPHAAGHSAG